MLDNNVGFSMRRLSIFIMAYQKCLGFVMHQNLYQRRSVYHLATIRDKRNGKIYIGEPEPLDKIGEVLEEILGRIGRAVDKVLGKKPEPILIPIPIPIDDEEEFKRA